jgi:hypothetical protein
MLISDQAKKMQKYSAIFLPLKRHILWAGGEGILCLRIAD